MTTRVMLLRTNPQRRNPRAGASFVAVVLFPGTTARQARKALPAHWSGGRIIPHEKLMREFPHIPILKDPVK